MGLEHYGLRSADAVVVRGTFHRELLARQGIRAEVVQDGVDPEQFRPQQSDRVRVPSPGGMLPSLQESEGVQVLVDEKFLVEAQAVLNDRATEPTDPQSSV